MRPHSPEYVQYLQSRAWKLKRLDALAAAGYKCQRCHKAARLEVHHLHYRTLGQEAVHDLEVLCPDCHTQADVTRAAGTRQRHWQARIEGWARKRYGDEWEAYKTWDEVQDAFQEWLDDQD